MKNSLLTIVSALALIVSATLAVLYFKKPAPRLAYVELNKVFEGFEYKKEMEAEYMQIKNTRQKMLDSMALDLERINVEIQADPNEQSTQRFYESRDALYLKQLQFQEEDAQTSGQFNDKIWTQINQYMQDYGKKHGYDFIYGAQGSGNLMYANGQKNITDEVLKYINERYQGNVE